MLFSVPLIGTPPGTRIRATVVAATVDAKSSASDPELTEGPGSGILKKQKTKRKFLKNGKTP